MEEDTVAAYDSIPLCGSEFERKFLALSTASPPFRFRLLQIRKLEGPDKLLDNISLVTDLPIPSPGPGEVLIRFQ